MESHIMFFSQINASHIGEVGGKGANLGELSAAGFRVPVGFCVTTSAYQAVIASSTGIDQLLAACAKVDVSDLKELSHIGEQIRDHINQLQMPSMLRQEIKDAWQSIGTNHFYAVRSSATAEDLPSASFAGQQDSYLHIRGKNELLEAIQKCWASLFTDRAIAYRTKNGIDHRHVFLSVVVQRMVHPEVSGILFTADPVDGNRLVTSIDASYGLGEALVSGMVTADLYKIKHQKIVSIKIATKKVMVKALEEGGTVKCSIPAEQQDQQVLTEEQILSLAELGRKIENHFGSPQDIEFCIEEGEIFVVQSRPITTLYPMPNIERDPLRVFLSFGHIQMMTKPMKPLGLSIFQTIFPFGKEEGDMESKYIIPAGGRLFVDPSDLLRYPLARKILPKVLANMDQKMSLALQEVIQRPLFKNGKVPVGLGKAVRKNVSPVIKEGYKNLVHRDPFTSKVRVETYIRDQLNKWEETLRGAKGENQLIQMQEFLATSLLSIFQNLLPFVVPFLISAGLLKKYLHAWLRDDRALQKLSQSFRGNITSEMGLAIGDLADELRTLPDVVSYLQTAEDDTFFEGLDKVKGGGQFRSVFEIFLAKYGRRCPGEIDITNPRWREKPTLLVPAILGHIRSVKEGEHRKKFELGAQEAKETEEKVLQQLSSRPIRYRIMKRLIAVYRNMGALREHHKYFLITILDECKKVIMKQADELVERNVLADRADVFYLTLNEVVGLVQGDKLEKLDKIITERKEIFLLQHKLNPPRVMTSEGEVVTAPMKQSDYPEHALIGTPVSSGVIEGRARIVRSPEEALLQEGEILVAPFTDPGWTPLFQSAIALVTEVGGLMTHGSVVAREYGIPAVVGVEDALTKIKNGQMIRVDGTRGIVEILSE